MRTMRHVALAAMAAAGLALAACGGGGSKKAAAPMDGDQQMEMTPVEKAKAAYDSIKAAEETVKALRSAMAKAVAEAQNSDGSKLSKFNNDRTLFFAGSSGAVEAAAKALVDAKTALEAEKAKADAAKTKAEEAKKVLDAQPSDTPGIDAQKDAAAATITRIEAVIKEIEKLLKGPGSIGKLVQDTGAGSPAAKAKAVTDRANYIFEPPEGGTHYSLRRNRPATPDELASIPTKYVAFEDDQESGGAGRSKAIMMHDAPDSAMTFREIVGEGNLVAKPFGDDKANVDVLPLDGMPVSSLTDDKGVEKAALPEFTGGKAETQHYKGIPGTVHCSGTCYLDGATMKGDLYFRATGSPFDRFHMKDGDLHYSEYKNFAIYGYWGKQSGGNIIFEFRVASKAAYYGNVLGAASATLPAKATYKGKALGLSVLKTYTAGTHTGTKSGQFTADVTLDAKFGPTDPKVGGTVDKFVGTAADPKWSIELVAKRETGDLAAAVAGGDQRFLSFTDGVAKGSTGGIPHGTDGEWIVETYEGPAGTDARPLGMMGAFKVPFNNGGAAGAFSTKMQTETAE